MMNRELLQKVRNGEQLTENQLKQLQEAGLLQPVEADWVDRAKKVPYLNLVNESGFEDEDSEHFDTN